MTNALKLSAVSVTAVLVAWLAPAVGDAMRFAANAHRVDGFHAVGAGASRSDREGKLVATDKEGWLPNNITRKVPNSAKLGGESPGFYKPTPCKVQLAGHAFVPANASDGAVVGAAYVHRFAGHDKEGQPRFECDTRDVTIDHVDPGLFEVDFGESAHCIEGKAPLQLRTSVTVKRKKGPPLIANSWSVCREGDLMLEKVRISDSEGMPTDAGFVISLFGELPVPPIP